MLRCLWDGGCDLQLAGGGGVTSVGRNEDCKITDNKCSRNQLELSYSAADNSLTVTQRANQRSFANGEPIGRGKSVTLLSGDKIQVLSGKLEYEFVSANPTKAVQKGAKSAEAAGAESKLAPDYYQRLLHGDCSVGGKAMTADQVAKLKLADGETAAPTEAKAAATAESSSPSSSKRRSARQDDATTAKKAKTEALEAGWTSSEELHVYLTKGVEARAKVAGFDIDGTIITTKSGRTFAKDEKDWKLLYPQVAERLRKLYHDEGYKVVFFTNQKGLTTGHVALDAFKRKVTAICAQLPLPVQVFVSPGALRFRKPYVGMWEEMEANGNEGVAVDRSLSLYVGDAAGRDAPSDKSRKKDFSCGDRLFAMNLGVEFKTPEQFYLCKAAEPFKMPDFDPRAFLQSPPTSAVEPANAQLTSGKPELVVMVGWPGSGKSRFAQQHLVKKGYTAVNRDTLKTWQKCVAAAAKLLKEGKSVVVDNTNPDLESRRRYTEVAEAAGVPVRCFVMNVGKSHAQHNVKFRKLMGTDKVHQEVNDMVINMYGAKYKDPTTEEGFTEVLRVNLIPQLKNEKEKETYAMYLVER